MNKTKKKRQKKPCFSDAEAITHSLLYPTSSTNSINGEVELLFKTHIILHLEVISH